MAFNSDSITTCLIGWSFWLTVLNHTGFIYKCSAFWAAVWAANYLVLKVPFTVTRQPRLPLVLFKENVKGSTSLLTSMLRFYFDKTYLDVSVLSLIGLEIISLLTKEFFMRCHSYVRQWKLEDRTDSSLPVKLMPFRWPRNDNMVYFAFTRRKLLLNRT